MMNFHQNYESLFQHLLWYCILISVLNFHQNIIFSLLLYLFIIKMSFITMGNFHHDKNIMMNFHHNNYFSSHWWNFIKTITFTWNCCIYITMISFHHIDDFSSQWWLFITIMILNSAYRYSSPWWFQHYVLPALYWLSINLVRLIFK